MQLPDWRIARAALQRRGLVFVPCLLGRHERTALFREAFRLVRDAAAAIDRRESGLRYAVVTGEYIRARAPLLFDLYDNTDVIAWIRAVTDTPSLGRSDHLRSAININCLSEPGQQYPLHRDAVPYTSIVFLSTVPAAAGGALVVRAADDTDVRIQPRAGDWLLMDGTRCPHAVEPLLRHTLRLTSPMVYPAEVCARPAALDAYLYGARTADASPHTDQL